MRNRQGGFAHKVESKAMLPRVSRGENVALSRLGSERMAHFVPRNIVANFNPIFFFEPPQKPIGILAIPLIIILYRLDDFSCNIRLDFAMRLEVACPVEINQLPQTYISGMVLYWLASSEKDVIWFWCQDPLGSGVNNARGIFFRVVQTAGSLSLFLLCVPRAYRGLFDLVRGFIILSFPTGLFCWGWFYLARRGYTSFFFLILNSTTLRHTFVMRGQPQQFRRCEKGELSRCKRLLHFQ
jgi:hypothetical protein